MHLVTMNESIGAVLFSSGMNLKRTMQDLDKRLLDGYYFKKKTNIQIFSFFM